MTGEHAAASTSIWFANQRVIRTILQVVAGLILAAVLFFGAVATFAPAILAELEAILPPGAYAWLVGFIAVCAAISGALSKLMAVPGVNDWLSRHTPFGSAPKSAVIDARGASDTPRITSIE